MATFQDYLQAYGGYKSLDDQFRRVCSGEFIAGIDKVAIAELLKDDTLKEPQRSIEVAALEKRWDAPTISPHLKNGVNRANQNLEQLLTGEGFNEVVSSTPGQILDQVLYNIRPKDPTDNKYEEAVQLHRQVLSMTQLLESYRQRKSVQINANGQIMSIPAIDVIKQEVLKEFAQCGASESTIQAMAERVTYSQNHQDIAAQFESYLTIAKNKFEKAIEGKAGDYLTNVVEKDQLMGIYKNIADNVLSGKL